jgi:hypothetical protein
MSSGNHVIRVRWPIAALVIDQTRQYDHVDGIAERRLFILRSASRRKLVPGIGLDA